ncbi:MAG TPA: VIT domain-containing protein [Acidobacteriota bacterium]|nr:VIT domain-containing protein [Acidobacteriota bacterium]HQF86757.1 VIT domain-containing protein [Acidobacteriota bacterium]HQG91445.1 VIT domain-containing protein [Acidobacteriota bacterium]HQK86344.1 VIT domain-containing protein [Acidobacteriota bacterium]
MARVTTEPDSDLMGLVTVSGQPVPLTGVAYRGRLCDLALELRVIQRYRNAEATPIEAMYLFPLPEAAAVCGLTVTLGDRVIRAEIEERDQAFDRYDEAMGRGDTAVLLDQERPNVFQMSVGNLCPGEEAVVEIRLVLEARPDGDGVRLMLPTTLSPRYTPPRLSAAERAEIERITPPYAADVPYGLTLELALEMASPIRSVSSLSHPVEVAVDGANATVRLAARETIMDRDFILVCRTAAPHQASVMAAESHGRDHLLLTLLPDLPAAEPAPRQLAFLVDCSGSMQGDSIDEARRAVELCLRALRPGDRFRIIRFGSRTDHLTAGFVDFSQASLDGAVARIRAMDADLGGTELLPALQELVTGAREGRLDVIVLTDGQVSNEEEVLDLVRTIAARWRIFSFGIGAGASEFLVRGLARESRGECEFIFPGERIEPKVLRQFGRIDTPLLHDARFDWGGVSVEQAPVTPPPVFAGEPLVVAARLTQPGALVADGAVVTFTALTAAGPREWSATVRRAAPDGPVPMLWARRRIRELEAGFGVPSGSTQRRNRPRAESGLVSLSKEYGLMSAETSFVGIVERPSDAKATAPAEARRVPVMVTAGWHGRDRIQPPRSGYVRISLNRSVDANHPMFGKTPDADSANMLFDLAPAIMARSTLSKRPSRSAAKPPTKQDPSSWYLDLLLHQRADGSFPLNDALAGWANRSLAELRDWARRLEPAGPEAETILATALALALLELKAHANVATWKSAAAKARAWLGPHPASVDGMPVDSWLRQQLK